MAAIHKLTALGIQRIRDDGRYGDGGGLYLQVDRGSRAWLFRFKRHGRTRYMGLGALDVVGLAQARDKALAARQVLQAGGDPLAAREAAQARRQVEAAKAMTFDDCRDGYIAAHEGAWRNPKHRQQWKNTLRTYASPVLGALPVYDVDVGLVMKVLEPIWTVKPETASRVRGRIEAVLSWATVRGHRVGENPARWRGHLDQLLPEIGKVRKVKHHPSLPYVDLPGFMPRLHDRKGIAARALEFTILTACRTADIVGCDRDDAPPMKWSHVDLDARTWTIPATKNGAAHTVPLPDAAVAVLKGMKALGFGEIVFPSTDKPGEPLSNGAMLAVLERMGHDDLTVHGFRATLKTWASERTNYQREVIEAVLAHGIISDKLEAAYRRGDFLDKRRRLMAAWAAFASSGKAAPRSAKVVALRAEV